MAYHNELGKIGEEFGATTGRKRQCNWMNLNTLIKSIRVNGVNKLIINKCDKPFTAPFDGINGMANINNDLIHIFRYLTFFAIF